MSTSKFTSKFISKSLSRRHLLKTIGALSVVNIHVGCGEKSASTNSIDTADIGSATEGGWLVGGTDLMTEVFPEDSLFEQGGTCTVNLTESTTEGPCYFQDSTGEDISEGLMGLPMMLCLRLIDSNCQPLADHTVEVWHCDRNGVYSGDSSESADATRFKPDFCTGGEVEAMNSSWYRGQLVTDGSGRVNFKSCFPGWYPGRTIHIHFAVSDASGTSRIVSQFCFTDDLAKEICTTHPLYTHRGEQDTPISIDNVFPNNIDSFLMQTLQNADGSLLAFHTIQVS